MDSVEVRAHVWGYLDKVNFKEGALVQKGDVLFELDPRPYQAVLNQAKAKVAQDQAQLTFDEAEYLRNLNLVRTGAVSRSDLDKTAAAWGWPHHNAPGPRPASGLSGETKTDGTGGNGG